MPTRPQLRPPTSTSVAASRSSLRITVHLLSRFRTGMYLPCTALVKLLSRSCIMSEMTEVGLFRIGELSRRSGVSPELLRAWERRYDLLRPTRSAGGLRLYSAADLERVRMMQRHLADGLAAAEAAALASRSAEPAASAVALEDLRRQLEDALLAFDEPRAQ